ncbi:hypothetical protein MSIMFI_01516 [Mycobacterium simulans]|uniref:hypothetical protein n=1 Tax=Mycobacterium simulans TaxID=627089 RepID=UPI00174A0EE1|nr:hypothetical protein [Mycobacterium simulans]SON60025.1 hypothetical protein MSIMFI_01516 [Mycobacterium simulans]
MHGAVVVSQTCDACLPHRERIQIAPVVRLEHHGDLSEAAAGKRPRYVAVPRLGPEFFADLDGITTVLKVALLSCERVKGVETDREIREFAFSVARRFGRFAYPDDVDKCLRPVTKALQSKARSERSPLGQILTRVHSFRVQCEDWSKAPYELTIIVILEPDVVPSDLGDIGEPPQDLPNASESNLAKLIGTYVTYLNNDKHSTTEHYFAWQYLAEAWARQCEESATQQGLTAIVGSVTAELAAVDDFPLSRYLTSESLDLDHLSDSRKPIA